MNQRFNPLWIGVIMYEKKMTIAEFIANLLRGDGWARPGVPILLGRYLEGKDIDRNQKVTVKYSSGHHGSGPRSWSEYQWEVQGLTLPEASIPGVAPIFGGPPDFMVVPTSGATTFMHASGAVRNRW